MKQDKQINWVMMVLFLAAVFMVALFHFANFPEKENLNKTATPVITVDLFLDRDVKDLDSQNDEQSSRNLQSVVLIESASFSNINCFLTMRQITPIWEKSLKIEESPFITNFFIPVLVISVFLIFYRLSRTSPGDDEPVLSLVNAKIL